MWIYVWVLVLVVLFFPKLITCLRFPTFAMFKLGGGMEVCLNVNCPSVNFWNNFDPILKDPLWKAWTTRSCHFCSVSYFPHWNMFFDFWLLAGWRTRLTRWKLSLGPISRIFSGENNCLFQAWSTMMDYLFFFISAPTTLVSSLTFSLHGLFFSQSFQTFYRSRTLIMNLNFF